MQAANEGRVRQGGWVTIVVDVTNQGGEISGQVVAELDGEFPHPQYVVPYTLPAGGRKRIPVTLQNMGNSRVSVKLYADNQLVRDQKLDLTLLAPQAILVGVLSSDELGIPGLSQMQSADQSAQVVRLSATTLADSATLLEDFDVIALSRFDSASLSPEQLRALEVWVGRGGTLLLAGGPEWKRTLGSLPAALQPGEVTGVRQVELAPLGELAGQPFTGVGSVSELRLTRGQALLSTGATPLVTSTSVGAGRVLYLAFDPGLNPFVGWPGQVQMLTRLLAATPRTMAFPGEQDWAMNEALQMLPDWGLPGFWTVALLLVGYLLLVGPVNYLILKRMDKREWAWASVPALSVLFVGAVYLVGFGRHQPLITHLITVTELSAGPGAATMDSHLGIYAPSFERLNLTVAGARLVKPAQRGPAPDNVTARVVAGDRTTVELRALSSYSMGGLSMQQDISVSGSLELVEAKLEGGVLTGRIANSLLQPVNDVTLTMGGTAHSVGRLEPGQTSEPFSLNVGSWAQPPMPGPGFIPEGPDTSVETARRNMVHQYVTSSVGWRLSGGLLVTGWTEQPLVSPGLSDLGKLVQGANMVWRVATLPAGGDSAEIPAGMVLGRPVNPKSVDWLPHGFMLMPGSHEFTLLLPPLNAAKVGEVVLDLRQTYPDGTITVSVKNQKTGAYLPVTGPTHPLTPWQEYLSPVGLIELRYDSTQHMDMQPPTVSVKGVRP